MRVTSTLRFVPEINFPWLTLSLPRATEHCAVGAPALADVSAFHPRLAVALPRRALARVPASLALLP
jgi:hypothetical protein